jgi:hypothetical protein
MGHNITLIISDIQEYNIDYNSFKYIMIRLQLLLVVTLSLKTALISLFVSLSNVV